MSLDFVETAVLLKELQCRMDCMVFVGASKRTQLEDSLIFASCGPFYGCMGLVESSRMMVLAGGVDDDIAD